MPLIRQPVFLDFPLSTALRCWIALWLCGVLLNTADAAGCYADSALGFEELERMDLAELMNVEVYTVSRSLESLADAPGIVSIVSREDIRRFGGNDLFDVLNRAASLDMVGTILYPRNNAVIRGDQGNGLDRHVLFLLNGRPFRETLNGGLAASIYAAFPLSMIERIEVTRGPGSVLYGTNAYSGIINVITRKPERSSCRQGEVAISGGSFDWRSGDGYYMESGDGYQITAGMRFSDTDGWSFESTDITGVPGGLDMSSRSGAVVFNGQFGDWSVDLAWLDADLDSIGVNLEWGSPQDIGQQHLFVNFGHDLQLGGRHRLETNLTYHRPDNYSMQSAGSSLRSDVDQTLLEMTYFGESGGTSWLIGGSLEYSRSRNLERWSPSGERLPNLVPDYDETVSTVYAQMDYRLDDHTRFSLGGQGVHHQESGWRLIPRLGLVHHFEEGFGVKLLYSEAYRSPSQVERNVDLPVVKGNPLLESETVHTADVQLFYQQAGGHASLTWFHNRQNNLIIRRPAQPNQPVSHHYNEGELVVRGVEFEAEAILRQRWYLTGSLTYQDNHNDEGVEDYTLASNWLAKFGLSYEIADKGPTIGLFNVWASAPPDLAQRNPDRLSVNPAPEARLLTSLNLAWPFGHTVGMDKPDDLVLNAYIHNLWDEEVYSPEINKETVNSVPAMAGRSVYTGVTLRF
jgi:outer membrane receptor for ferrienterochelin and colicin